MVDQCLDPAKKEREGQEVKINEPYAAFSAARRSGRSSNEREVGFFHARKTSLSRYATQMNEKTDAVSSSVATVPTAAGTKIRGEKRTGRIEVRARS